VKHFSQTENLGLILQKILQADAENPAVGLKVLGVYPESPADRAGLRYGDILTRINGRPLTRKGLEALQNYFELFPKDGNKHVALSYVRADGVHEVKLSEAKEVSLTAEPARRWAHPYHLILERRIAEALSPEGYSALEQAFQTRVGYWNGMALPILRTALSHPRYAMRLEASGIFQLNSSQTPSEVLFHSLQTVAEQFPGTTLAVPSEAAPVDLKQWLQWFEKKLGRISEASGHARAKLTPQEDRILREKTLQALNYFSQSMFLTDQPDPKAIESMFEFRSLAQKMETRELLSAATLLAVLTTPEYTHALQELVGKAGEGILQSQDTPFGKIVIGGTGPNHYREAAAVILDLGGDDSYEFDAQRWPLLVVDLSGRDHYRWNPTAQGLPEQATVHLLYDLEGNDRYQGGSGSVAFGTLGVSLLVDARGDDNYEAEDFSLGSGIFGVGLLIDGSGKDRYRSRLFSQGFGGSLGVGMLVDLRGEDNYEAAGQQHWRHPDTNFSQGVGAGFPYFSSGGLGALVDLAGDDNYRGNNYTQGVGYYGGVGLLFDAAGKDQYSGGKFSQGAGVHGAVGILRDGSGDDRYVSEAVRAQGVGYDLGIGYLHDGGGDDFYFSKGQSQGFSAQNGLAVFWDERGQDRFLCDLAEECGGKTGENTYEGGRDATSLSLFMSPEFRK